MPTKPTTPSTLSDDLERAVLVVAHPDDEILWFSSVVDRVARVAVCFLDVPGLAECTAGRRRVAVDYPLDNVEFLGIAESVSFGGADWNAPIVTEYGLDVQKRPGTLQTFDGERYRANYEELKERLAGLFEGVASVITHNPWGEYGHEDHVQVHRAVLALQRSMSFDVWYPNYCSERSYALMLRSVGAFCSDMETVPANAALASSIEALYRRHRCWTWPFEDYRHPPYETFIRHRDDAPERAPGASCPLNFVRLDKPPPSTPPARQPVVKRIANSLWRRSMAADHSR